MTTVIVGVGNTYRHDDGAGPAVADRLLHLGLRDVVVTDSDGEPTRLIDAWDNAPLAIVVDAVRTATAPAGTIHRVDAPPVRGRPGGASGHAFGLGDAYALSQALGRSPQRLVVYGIEGEFFTTGQGLSPAVARAVDEVVAVIVAEIGGANPCA